MGQRFGAAERPVMAGSDFERLLTGEVSGHSARAAARRRFAGIASTNKPFPD